MYVNDSSGRRPDGAGGEEAASIDPRFKPLTKEETSYVVWTVLLQVALAAAVIVAAFTLVLPTWQSNDNVNSQLALANETIQNQIAILKKCLRCHPGGGVDVLAVMEVDGDAKSLEQFSTGYNMQGMDWEDSGASTPATVSLSEGLLFSFENNVATPSAEPGQSYTSSVSGEPGYAGMPLIDLSKAGNTVDKRCPSSYDEHRVATPAVYLTYSPPTTLRFCVCTHYFKDTAGAPVPTFPGAKFGEWCETLPVSTQP